MTRKYAGLTNTAKRSLRTAVDGEVSTGPAEIGGERGGVVKDRATSPIEREKRWISNPK